MKEYFAYINIEWATSFEAKDKEDFIIKLKEQYKQDYNIDLTNEEINVVE